MSSVAEQLPSTATAAPPPPAAVAAPAGDPAVLGLPAFVAGSVALAFALVGYVSPAAAGSAVPIILAATGLGLIVSAAGGGAVGLRRGATIFRAVARRWRGH